MKKSVLCSVLLLSACGEGNLPNTDTNSSAAQQLNLSAEAAGSIPTAVANQENNQIVAEAPPILGAALQQSVASTGSSTPEQTSVQTQAVVTSEAAIDTTELAITEQPIVDTINEEQIPEVTEPTNAAENVDETVVSNELTTNTTEPVSVVGEVEAVEAVDTQSENVQTVTVEESSSTTTEQETEESVAEEIAEAQEVAEAETTEEEVQEAVEEEAQECVAYTEPEPSENEEDTSESNEPEVGAALPLIPNSGETPNGPNYEDLLQSDARIGFGASTTGGYGGELCLVTNLSDSGSGSFRDCVEKNEANWIRFDVNGIIQSSGFIYLNSNKTIDGRGADITLSGENGLICFGKTNIIVHNIKFKNIGNGIKLRESCNNVWVDHVDFSNMGDESLAADKASTNITFSWNRIYNTDKATLIGGTPEQTETRNSRITMHHNVLSADQRNPNVRHAGVHVFNNLIEEFLWEGMVATQGGKVISQNNLLRPNDNMPNRDQSQVANVHNQGDYEIGFLWSEGDTLENGASKSGPGHNPDDVSKFNIPYNFELETVTDSLEAKIRDKAGWQQ